MAGCLSGLRVLDLSCLLPGPLAARHLAERSAEVVKVVKVGEPGAGDPAGFLLQSNDDRAAGRGSGFCRDLDRCKSELRLDLRSARAASIC